jgi:thiamine-monophosphate kinase
MLPSRTVEGAYPVPSLRELGEVEVLRRLAAARRAPAGTVVDAGDDAAVLRGRADHDLVVTTDALVEGVHYLPDWLGPAALGARLAVANLSDLAAMCATPRWALLSLGVHADRDAETLLELQRGLAAALERDGAGIVGGNLAAVGGPEWFTLTLIGETARGAGWTRHGARPGDVIAVTGSPGRAGAGARLARALGEGARALEWAPLLEAWLAPVARVALAQALGQAGGVTAAIDISDGVGGDLARLCEASGVGAEIHEPSWPADDVLSLAAPALGVTVDALRFGPSDDYELLLAIDPAAQASCAAAAAKHDVSLAFVGRFTDSPNVIEVRDARGGARLLAQPGYDHFAGGAYGR